MTIEKAKKLESDNNQLRAEIERLNDEIERLSKLTNSKISEPRCAPVSNGTVNEEDLFSRLLARILADPAILKLSRSRPELEVNVSRRTVQANESDLIGMIAVLLSEGFLDNTQTATAVWKETKRRWNYGGISARCYEQLDKLTTMGFVTKENDGYKAVEGMKVNVNRE